MTKFQKLFILWITGLVFAAITIQIASYWLDAQIISLISALPVIAIHSVLLLVMYNVFTSILSIKTKSKPLKKEKEEVE